ncbi:MAG TPA: BlaI/MecI/CopY family transcriptional regulator [Phycisphaerae bacterium]|nr:BlaI/MecI/CopY family transcriptional regulator [Phycisphaerales bacterium]HNO76945.1 BlaI/MecI/CopY family transcriptional regulator [Phycisphaerae bacterium]
MSDNEYELGSAELDVLRALWDGGPGTVRDVMGHLPARRRKVAYTTVQTLLNRLEQKGYVKCDKSDIAHVFRAKLTRERVQRARLKSMIGQLYDGAVGAMALHLVKTQKLSREELAELQKLIEKLDE